MSAEFLLPCPACGAKLRVKRSQAGEERACPCGATLEIPTLRGLAELTPVAIAEQPVAWSRLQGSLFVAGVFVLVLGSGLTVWLLQRLPPRKLVAPAERLAPVADNEALSWEHVLRQQPASALSMIDELDQRQGNLNSGESLRIWSLYREVPDVLFELPLRRRQQAARRSRKIALACTAGGIAGVLGLALIGSAVALRKK